MIPPITKAVIALVLATGALSSPPMNQPTAMPTSTVTSANTKNRMPLTIEEIMLKGIQTTIPIATTTSEAFLALTLLSPVEIAVIPKAAPTPRRSPVNIPIPGDSNQLVKSKVISVIAVAAVAMRNTPIFLVRSPPTIPIQINPLTSEIRASQSGGICGSAKKSLNPIAPYCFSNTATQKTGREKNKKAVNVTV